MGSATARFAARLIPTARPVGNVGFLLQRSRFAELAGGAVLEADGTKEVLL
jgi:hypothetical protein